MTRFTAAQVKRIYYLFDKHWHDLTEEYDMPEASALPEYSYDWQAIADELNAAENGQFWNKRAERTCRIEWRDDSYDTDAGYEHDGAYFCTACRAELPYPLQECWDDYQAGNCEKPINHCPSCGVCIVGENQGERS